MDNAPRNSTTVILASASPRREELLGLAGIRCDVRPADVDEFYRNGESPEEHALRLAGEKAAAVSRMRPRDWVLGADTVVIIDGEVLGKPRGRDEAGAMMRKLSGRTHRVITAFTVMRGTPPVKVGRSVVSEVTFRELTAGEMEAYVSTEEPYDKAGGYAVQGRAAQFIREIRGSYTNVIGLPLCEVVETLRELGVISLGGG